MFLKGKIISLRALEPNDSDLLYCWENDRSLWPVSFTQVPFSRFVLDEFVNSAHNDIYTNKQIRFIITDNLKDLPVGTVDLFEFEPQHMRVGLGIYVHQNEQKKGVASEAIELMKLYCFQSLLLKQIFVHVSASNTASIALFEKLGFEKSGLKKCWHKIGLNSFEDVWFMQLLNKSE